MDALSRLRNRASSKAGSRATHVNIAKLDSLRKLLDDNLRAHRRSVASEQQTLFSKTDFLDGLLAVQHDTRRQLANMFGAERHWKASAAPLVNGLFTYKRNDFSEGLFIAYYEPVDELLINATMEVDKRFREAVFMKGG